MMKSLFWWKSDEAHQQVTGAARYLRNEQSYRTAMNLRHARLYGNMEQAGFGLREYSRSPHVNKVALNIVASCVDTLSAKIAKNRPRPSFQTFGGDWALQQKAKLLDKFCQGKFYETKLYELGREAFIDACIFDAGVIKFYEEAGRVCAERVLSEELLVDEAEAVYGNPRQLFQTKAFNRDVLLGLYHGEGRAVREAIERAKKPDGVFTTTHGFGDMLEVIEAWHLPSGKDAKDGKHVICVEGATLHEEKWEKDYFPFSFMRFSRRRVGFWGQGLAERLTGIQLEVNRLLREITETLRLMSKGRIFMEASSKVVPGHLTNEIGTIIKYTGTPPTVAAVNAVPPEMFAQLDRLYSRAFEEAGISQLSANSRKPPGLDSGKALREFNDIETERFVLVGQSYEGFYMEAARILIDMTRDIATRDGSDGYKVRAPGKRFLDTIDWKDIDLEEDEYFMQAFPVSSLPTTPAARVQTVQDWIDAGFVDAVEGRRLLDFPDLESSTNLAVAALDDVDATIDDILKGEDVGPVEDYQDMELIVQRGNAAYLRARRDKAPDKALANLRNWIDQAADRIAATKQPAQQPQQPMAPSPDMQQAAAAGAPPGPPAMA